MVCTYIKLVRCYPYHFLSLSTLGRGQTKRWKPRVLACGSGWFGMSLTAPAPVNPRTSCPFLAELCQLPGRRKLYQRANVSKPGPLPFTFISHTAPYQGSQLSESSPRASRINLNYTSPEAKMTNTVLHGDRVEPMFWICHWCGVKGTNIRNPRLRCLTCRKFGCTNKRHSVRLECMTESGGCGHVKCELCKDYLTW